LKRKTKEAGVPDEPTAKAHPGGIDDEFPDGPPTTVIAHHGCRLLLRFAPGDVLGYGDVQEIRLLPGDDAQLRPQALLRFIPEANLYLAYARSAMRILGDNEDTPAEERWARFHAAADALLEVAGPGRGLTPQFYRLIADNYQELVDEGEPHPVKKLGEIHHATISAASRWVKEARRRGLLPEKEVPDAR
jgi:hypothetical protein